MYSPAKSGESYKNRHFVAFLVAFFVAVLFSGALASAGVTDGVLLEKEVQRIEDGDKCYLTVFGDVPFDVQKLKAMHPDVHFRHVKANDPIAKRYQPTVGVFPAVVYQSPDGKVLFKVSGDNVPQTENELQLMSGRCRPFRPCPEPTPSPSPPVEPPTISPPIVDDTPVVVPDSPEEAPIWVYVAIGGAALVLSIVIKVKREVTGD